MKSFFLYLPIILLAASNVQNEFETSVTYKNDEDTENGTDTSDDGNWTYEEEPLKGTDGSRVAAYNPTKATWRCDECGEYCCSIHFRMTFSMNDNNPHVHYRLRIDLCRNVSGKVFLVQFVYELLASSKKHSGSITE